MNDYNYGSGGMPQSSQWESYDENGQPTQWEQMPDGTWAQVNKPRQTAEPVNAGLPGVGQPTYYNQPPNYNQPTNYGQPGYGPNQWGMSPYNQTPGTPQPYNQGNVVGPVLIGVATMLLVMVLLGGHFFFFPWFLLIFPFMMWGRRGRRGGRRW